MSGTDDAQHTIFALQQSEERFRLLVDSVIDYAIFLLEPDGRVASWNAGAERLKGYSADDIIGSHYSVFYTEEERAAEVPAKLLATARETGHAERSGWRVRKDGTRFWADVVITALFDGDRHTGFAKVTRDMTESHLWSEAQQQALEEHQRAVSRLQDLDRWRRHFIDSVVHDLQTPVAAIEGFAHLLQSGRMTDDERVTALNAVRSNTRALQELIDNLRAFTVLSAGEAVLEPEPIELRAFVRELASAMAPLFGDRERHLEVPELEFVADPHALERVFRNLLGNAIRHTPTSASVTVRAEVRKGWVRVEVEDEGEGIPEALLPRIFDRFQSGGHGGTGLGLPIAREYVELHGGTLTAENVDGRGAIFAFALPVAGPSRSE